MAADVVRMSSPRICKALRRRPSLTASDDADGPSEPNQRRAKQRRTASVNADRIGFSTRQFDKRPTDLLLQRMIGIEIVLGSPTLRNAGQQHGRVFARTIHQHRRALAPTSKKRRVLVRIQWIRGRGLKRRQIKISLGQDLFDGGNVQWFT